jgi:hypothetical protein
MRRLLAAEIDEQWIEMTRAANSDAARFLEGMK